MTKPKSAGEMADWIVEKHITDFPTNTGRESELGNVRIVLRHVIRDVIDSATCCGCAGLRAALQTSNAQLKLVYQFGVSTKKLEAIGEQIDHNNAALSAPCTCQGATGEPVEAWWRDFVEGEKPREGDRLTLEMPAYTGKQRWMRRVQERKEV